MTNVNDVLKKLWPIGAKEAQFPSGLRVSDKVWRQAVESIPPAEINTLWEGDRTEEQIIAIVESWMVPYARVDVDDPFTDLEELWDT